MSPVYVYGPCCLILNKMTMNDYFNGVLIIANVASKQTSLFAGDVYQVKC